MSATPDLPRGPERRARDARARRSSSEAAPAFTLPRRLLVLGRDAATSQELVNALAHPQVRIESVLRDDAVIARCRELRPDAIVLDLERPLIDCDILRVLRRDPDLRFVRVVLLTEPPARDPSLRDRVLRALGFEEAAPPPDDPPRFTKEGRFFTK